MNIDKKLYNTYYRIKTRCENSNCDCFKNYGGRGIKNEWKNQDEFFKDMRKKLKNAIKKYGPRISIDRIDVNGNYNKENCRWATSKQQQRNKRNNRIIRFNGKVKTLVEWSEETGISPRSLHNRLERKWTIKRTLTQKRRVYPEKLQKKV